MHQSSFVKSSKILAYACVLCLTSLAEPLVAADSVFPDNVELKLLWQGGEFTEGVAARSDGLIFFSDIPSEPKTAGRILVFNPATGSV